MQLYLYAVSTLFVLTVSPDFSTAVTNAEHNPRLKRQIVQNTAIEIALRDKSYVRKQLNCVLYNGPCDKVGRDLKRLAPEVLRGHCPGCPSGTHQKIRKVISHVQRNYPREWSIVLRKYFGSPQPLGPQNPQQHRPPPPPPQFQQFSPGRR